MLALETWRPFFLFSPEVLGLFAALATIGVIVTQLISSREARRKRDLETRRRQFRALAAALSLADVTIERTRVGLAMKGTRDFVRVRIAFRTGSSATFLSVQEPGPID